MNFDLSEEQRLLQETVERFARASGSTAVRGGAMTANAGRETWTQLAEIGVLGLPFSEEEGGFGGGPIESMIVAEAIGRELLTEPFTASIVLAGSLLRYSARALDEIVPRVVDGSVLPALAHQEPQARYDLSDVTMRADRSGSEGWVLNGSKVNVVAGDVADLLIVSARLHGNRFDEDGIGLFLVSPDASGLLRTCYAGEDGVGRADFAFSAVKLGDEVRIDAANGYDMIERACHVASAASLAESVGVMESMLSQTVEHLKTRSQFGRKIGEFQALQHRAAEMLVAVEQAKSMAIFAASMAAADDVCERRKAISASKVLVGQALRFVGQQAVQLHGGIGITEEQAIGRYFRRATVLGAFLGDCDHHLAQFAATDGFIAPMPI